ncbi:MAG: branched-chain amino acid ABC transporter substrate-binding protein [Candidatus Devosia symbiotica]|nr:branched-chain amino acid ABC transporter substrate-binding protein [Candidatus Devosia symbiotica]
MKIAVLLTTTAIALAFAAPAYAEMKIGILVPTTGSEAAYGQDMANAVDLAIAEINAAGGIMGEQLSSVVGDDGCDPQQAVNAASKLASSDVVGIVGGYCSGATVPTLKIFGDTNIPFVIAAANSTKLISANPGNAFMINSTSNDQATKAIEYFTANGVKSLAIVNQGDAYSQDLADMTKKNWEAAGNIVPSFEVANKGEQDYSSIVTAIRSANPDAVFWTAYYADGGLLIRQLRQAGFQGKIAVGDGSNSPELFNIAGSAAEGVVSFSNPTAEFLPEAKSFIADYTAAYGSAPGPYAPLAYDGMNLLANAIKAADGTDAAAINAAINAADYTGITGAIIFTPENTLAHSNFVVLQSKGGKWTPAE